MSRGNFPLYSLNGGMISALATGRIDMPRMAICGELVKNWIISTLGWMGLRPGTLDIARSNANARTRLTRFVGTGVQTSLIELTGNKMRIINDDVLVERAAVGTTLNNGGFLTLVNWTSDVAAGGSITASGGKALIAGNGIDQSTLTQQILIDPSADGEEHGITIVVPYGPIRARIGSTSGDDDVVKEMLLQTGTHRLAVVLSDTVFLQFATTLLYPREVGPVSIDAAGIMEVPTPWAQADLSQLRTWQEGDVIFCASRGYRQYRIVGRGRRSWSVEEYRAVKGPFIPPIDDHITITPSAKIGATNLLANRALFKQGHVGSIWELQHGGQDVVATLSDEDQFSEPIRISGVTNVNTSAGSPEEITTSPAVAALSNRTFTARISGTWAGTIRLQRSFGNPDSWTDWRTYTANTEVDLTEPNDNSIVFLRIGFKAGEYTSGTADVELNYPGGVTVGVVRIRTVTDRLNATAEVVRQLGDVVATSNWREGSFSAAQEYPRDAVVNDGRLWWLGRNFLYGSVSDAFDNYNDDVVGDSGPVIRSIATGPADGNLWFLKLFNLMVGSGVAINMVRSSAIDEPITPTAFSAREIDQTGAADLVPRVIGERGIFVGRDAKDLLEITGTDAGGLSISSLIRLVPDLTAAGIVKIFVQRRPDPRIYVILANGRMGVVTYNRDENVIAWTTYETDGAVEDGEMLPGVREDDVYLTVRRTFSGVAIRCIEKQAYVGDTHGGADNHLLDNERSLTSLVPKNVWAVSPDFNGKTVSVWANNQAYAGLVITDGTLTLPAGVTATAIAYGLPYVGQFKSTKLAYAAEAGTAMGQVKRVDHLELQLNQTAMAGLSYGPNFSRLDPMPQVTRAGVIAPETVQADLDDNAAVFSGSWSTDSRFCIQAQSPWPVTIKGVVVSIGTLDSR